jgi:hypothetical protein
VTRAYPLTWPEGFPRTRSPREKGSFSTGLNAALGNVQNSLKLFAQDSRLPLGEVVISSNVTLGQAHPDDPGVAVWFVWDKQQVCIPVDRYATVEANLQAVHHIVEARRTELRHGGLAIVRATFTGFKLLPAPDWRRILGVRGEATIEHVESAYRLKARAAHPDKGGSQDAMAELNRARDAARLELGDRR